MTKFKQAIFMIISIITASTLAATQHCDCESNDANGNTYTMPDVTHEACALISWQQNIPLTYDNGDEQCLSSTSSINQDDWNAACVDIGDGGLGEYLGGCFELY